MICSSDYDDKYWSFGMLSHNTYERYLEEDLYAYSVLIN